MVHWIYNNVNKTPENDDKGQGFGEKSVLEY